MIEVNKDSKEAKILAILLEKYPITMAELAEESKFKKPAVEAIVGKFRRRGIVSLDVLPDKTYVRLRRTHVHFTGHKNPQKRKIVKKRIRRKVTAKPYEGMMFR